MTPKPPRSISRFFLVLLALSFAQWTTASKASSSDPYFEQGLKAFQRGAFEEAVSRWAEAVSSYEREGKPAEQINALIHLSQAYSALGQYKQAMKNLETALELAERSQDAARSAAVLASLGNVYIAMGPPETAETYLRRSLRLAREVGDASLTAGVLNDLGTLFAKENKNTEAIAAYQESVVLATRAGHPSLSVRALINTAVASRQKGDPQESHTLLETARDQVRQLSPSYDTAVAWISLGVAYRDLRGSLPTSSDHLTLRASGAFTEAATLAEKLGDRRTSSYAWGYLGTLYEDERRYAEALQLTRRAIFAAQQVHAPESLYRWQWQAGRLLKSLGAIDDAIAAYRGAVYTLQSIRQELSAGCGGSQRSLRESVGPVYLELVDLLLRRARSGQNRDQVQAYLLEARDHVESLKVAELRDYFRDDCVDLALSKVTTLDVVSQTAVVVYPVLLPDRTELLVSLPSGVKQFSVPVGADTLTQEVRQFRRTLEKRTTREYLPHAQQLYEWLIRPLEADFASLRVDTLVFVPDGPLRTIPMAALHDGKQFLVSKYALAITPGLNLTDPRPISRTRLKVLAVGVTEPVLGFPPLPNVSTELQTLRTLFRSTTLVDQEFRVSQFEEALKDQQFTIVHIASHAHFGSDVATTFLLAFDGKLTMDRLGQLIGVFKFRDDPLELLTLSACETAAGDDRAALGLAGVAIKAGARSALATLWDINDRVSSDLVADFYQELQDPSRSRAKALQRAQLKILADPRYEHPGFWSPFLLINNWL